jgi:hypothetical protein
MRECRVIEAVSSLAIARQDGQPMAFASLWESFRWPGETVTQSFAILPATANAEMAELHDRMPVVLEQQDWPICLGEGEGDHTVLLRPAHDGLLLVWPVGQRVGSPRNTPRAGRLAAVGAVTVPGEQWLALGFVAPRAAKAAAAVALLALASTLPQ